jgi:hypothetical protein
MADKSPLSQRALVAMEGAHSRRHKFQVGTRGRTAEPAILAGFRHLLGEVGGQRLGITSGSPTLQASYVSTCLCLSYIVIVGLLAVPADLSDANYFVVPVLGASHPADCLTDGEHTPSKRSCARCTRRI